MGYNPVDERIQDLLVIHAGTYLGGVTSSSGITLNSSEAASIKGGMVAYQSAANEFGISDGTTSKAPFGLFIGDGSRANDVSVVFRGGLYETYQWDKTQTLSDFTFGTALTCTSGGLLEPLGVQSKVTVGICTKVPASTSDSLGIKLLI